ncbi:MAG: tyrosine-type recombinase/integrase [Sphaerochaeta associata]|uniref:tyrosine-type recombinase/integrase n=1 Tax=Sphaerochaeta associata TaxID=1129264 RepID=UPI002B1F0C77|nr:tyrosine-type recombinase/integrase [Sphaerochaeta associata]MEA5108350.1 tyrosine-type recombinase/integrase [Sphaerochaeta associata]
MITPCFNSKLAPYMSALLAERDDSGFFTRDLIVCLKDFDTFIIEKGFDDGTFSQALADDWSIQRPTENKASRNSRIGRVKLLSEYMDSMGLPMCASFEFGSSEHPKTYVPTREECSVLFSLIDKWKPVSGLPEYISCTYSVLFRLYYCLGLRLNEAVELQRKDVSFDCGILYLRHSKGDKDRIVFVQDDLLDLMKRYDDKVSAYLPGRQWFFPSKKQGQHPWKHNVCRRFRQFWQLSFPDWTGKRPTVHSLRHAFVVYTVNDWVEDGKDASALFPYLSRFLGHASIEDTMYYYHTWDTETGAFARFIDLPSAVEDETEGWL